MSTSNGTGIDYPTIELGGVTYTLKFTRGDFAFRLSDNGINMFDRVNPTKNLAANVKILHMFLTPQFPGTYSDLAEFLIDEKKVLEAATVINAAMGKVFPLPTVAATVTGEKPSGLTQ